MLCDDDYEIGIECCDGTTTIDPFTSLRVDGKLIERPLTADENFRASLLSKEAIAVAIRETFGDDNKLRCELMANPDKIPDGLYILDACLLFEIDDAISAERYAGTLDLLTTEQRLTGFPRAWELLGYLFSKKTREEIYDPSYQVLLEDYLGTRAKYDSLGARLWLGFCFFVRTTTLVIECSGSAWRVLLMGIAMAYGPEWLRVVLRQIFQDQ